MHMLHNNHIFTIALILPSHLHYLLVVSAFPLSWLLQNSYSCVIGENIRTDLHFRQEA